MVDFFSQLRITKKRPISDSLLSFPSLSFALYKMGACSGKQTVKQLTPEEVCNLIVNMKITSKMMKKEAKRLESDAKEAEKECAAKIKAGGAEAGRLSAERAVRKRNEAGNTLRLSERLDTVVDHIESAQRTNQVVLHLGLLVRGLAKQQQGAQDTTAMSDVLSQFEAQMDNAGVRAAAVNDAMRNEAAATTPDDEVVVLIEQVAAANNLDVQGYVDSVRLPQTARGTQSGMVTARTERSALRY